MTFILVVDDDPDIADLAATALRRDGHEVATASGAPEALALIGSRPIDMLITDFHMPGMTGLELAAALRADPRRAAVPILMITAAAPGDAWDSALLADVVTKPFSPRQLRERTADVLAQAPVTA